MDSIRRKVRRHWTLAAAAAVALVALVFIGAGGFVDASCPNPCANAPTVTDPFCLCVITDQDTWARNEMTTNHPGPQQVLIKPATSPTNMAGLRVSLDGGPLYDVGSGILFSVGQGDHTWHVESQIANFGSDGVHGIYFFTVGVGAAEFLWTVRRP